MYRRAAALPHITVRGDRLPHRFADHRPFRRAPKPPRALRPGRPHRGGRHCARPRRSRRRGIGIRYRDEEFIDPQQYALAIRRVLGSRRHRLLFEPGASWSATRDPARPVSICKPGDTHHFAIVDAAMTTSSDPRSTTPGTTWMRCSRRGGIGAAGRSWGRFAKAAIFLHATASSRLPPAIFSRCVAPAPTVS